MCAGVGVELREPAVAVSGERDAQARLLVDADHARLLGLCEHRIAEHVAVVLARDPRLRGEVRRGNHREEGRLEFVGCGRTLQPVGRRGIGLQGVLP